MRHNSKFCSRRTHVLNRIARRQFTTAEIIFAVINYFRSTRKFRSARLSCGAIPLIPRKTEAVVRGSVVNLRY